MRILPLGDSVVLGDGASGGFRTPLEQLLLRAKLDFRFVGSENANSFEMQYPEHEGHRRATLSDLRETVVPAASEDAPEIILLYAGIEDVRSLPDPGIAVARYGKLLDTIFTANPDVFVLCSQLIPAKDYLLEQKVKLFNIGLGTLIEKRARKHPRLSRVKMHARVSSHTLNEEGMPTEIGYNAMADIWFAAIGNIYRRVEETL